MRTAFISGITGQVGSYLAELLLKKGYQVHGLLRRASSISTSRLDPFFDQLHLHFGDLSDSCALVRLMGKIQPDEVYHLGAMSHVQVSFEIPEYAVDVGATGTMRLLEAIRLAGLIEKVRFYNAASSEMFGGLCCPADGYTELSPFRPRSPYGAAKLCAYWLTINYRESYGLHASNGIVFNTESPRRGETFVTRKITRAVARIRAGLQSELRLGNLKAMRDWSYAPEAAAAMWLMLQQSAPDDYIIATGETHSVEEFLNLAFAHVGLDWARHVVIDPKYFRPAEVDLLLGNPAKAKRLLGWAPSIKFYDLVRIMVDAEKIL